MAMFLAVQGNCQPARAGAQDPKRAARAYLFQDPHRKIKNEKGQSVTADLRPLFAWVSSRKGGESPMPAWKRFEVKISEHLKEGMLVENVSDKLTFFVKNYPRKLPVGTVLQVFVLDVGLYTHAPAGGTKLTLHAFDYGVPYNPATEKKAAAPTKK
jgi:hypothetical protein